MFSFSKRVDYALASVVYMVRLNVPVNANRVASFYSFPQRLTANILKELAMKGILKSIRGVYGGYYLAKPASEISVYDLITALEGPISMADCVNDAGCKYMGICAANPFVLYVQNHVSQLLKRIKLEDLANVQVFNPSLLQSKTVTPESL